MGMVVPSKALRKLGQENANNEQPLLPKETLSQNKTKEKNPNKQKANKKQMRVIATLV